MDNTGRIKRWLLVTICISFVLMTGLLWSKEIHARLRIIVADALAADHGFLPLHSSTPLLPVTSMIPQGDSKYSLSNHTDRSNHQEVVATVPQSQIIHRKDVKKTILYTRGFTNLGVFNNPMLKNFENYSPQYCGGYKCAIRTTTSFNTAGADIAVFFGIGISGNPPKKPPGQLWAFQTGESQRSLAASHPQMWDGLFNYSIVYLRSSESNEYDLSWSRHFSVRDVHLSRNFYREKLQMVGKKEPNALWFVSNCANAGIFRVQSARVEYAHFLSDHVKVDAFTRGKNCATKLGHMLRTKDGAEPSFNNYWFYLSFENSLCKDYITEKFWKIITSDSLAIPVVLGGSSMRDYEAIAPPNSYIDVRNFTSPRHLAQHLKYVTENEDAFNFYHRWRNEYQLRPHHNCEYVRVCVTHSRVFTIPHFCPCLPTEEAFPFFKALEFHRWLSI